MCFQVPLSILWQLFELCVSTRYSGIKNLARSTFGIAGSQPKFYDTIQSHTMVAANGVLSQSLTKLPGINDLSKLKVSVPVT